MKAYKARIQLRCMEIIKNSEEQMKNSKNNKEPAQMANGSDLLLFLY